MGGTRVKSVWDRERERERERERVQVHGYVAGQTSVQPRERERWKESARGEEEVHEEESLGGSVGERERGIAREQEGEELYPRNLEKPTLFIPTHPLAPPTPTSVATLWTSAY